MSGYYKNSINSVFVILSKIFQIFFQLSVAFGVAKSVIHNMPRTASVRQKISRQFF